MLNYNETKEENIFLNIFSAVNRVFTVEDYLLTDTIPQNIWKYLYISNGIDVKGRYFRYEDNYINLFVIKNEGQFIYTDILFTDKPTLVIVIPETLETNSDRDFKIARSNMVKTIYSTIFNYLESKINVDIHSSLGTLLHYAPIVLSVFTEYHTNNNPIPIEYFIEGEDISENIINSCLESNVEDLFRYGGLIAVLKENE